METIQNVIAAKYCPGCSKSKSIVEFPKLKSRKDGLYPYCKDCSAAKAKALYYSKHEVNRLKKRLRAQQSRKGEPLKSDLSSVVLKS